MTLTPTQQKDLRPIKAEEIVPGGVFYLKDGSNFRRCVFYQEELKKKANEILRQSREYASQNRLFVRVSKPWKSFE